VFLNNDVFSFILHYIFSPSSLEYLGHIFCSDAKDDRNIMCQCHQLHTCGNVIFWKCTNNAKIMLFNTCCHLCTHPNFGEIIMFTVYINYTSATTILFWKLIQLPRYCSASVMFAKRLVPDCKVVIQNLVYQFMKCLDNWH